MKLLVVAALLAATTTHAAAIRSNNRQSHHHIHHDDDGTDNRKPPAVINTNKKKEEDNGSFARRPARPTTEAARRARDARGPYAPYIPNHANARGRVPPPPPLPDNFPLEDIAAEMTQFDVNNFIDPAGGAYKLQRDKLIDYFSRRQIGSLFNLPTVNGMKRPNPDINEWRAMMEELYEISSSYGTKIPVLYGLDSVHGANYIYNATLFPQQIGTAATFNTTCAAESGRITGLETRFAGIPWLFSPILDIAVQPTWARVFETFGEDTFVASEMGHAIVAGIQTPPTESLNESSYQYTAAACIKHFLGYPDPRTGHDRTPSYIPMNVVLQYFAPSFKRAIDSGALSVMENYVEVNGRPTAASELMLNFLLRDTFKFNGMLVSDYNEIFNLASFHYTSENFTEAIYDSFNTTSMDMGMVGMEGEFPRMASTILDNIRRGRITAERARESGARLIDLKRKLGVLDGSPVPKKNATCVFACDSHRASALDATRQSITLLENKPQTPNAKNKFSSSPLLPLDPKTIRSVAVVGQACNSLPLLAGGWTIGWQGATDDSGFAYGTTIYAEIKKRFPAATQVSYSQGCNVTEGSSCGAEFVAESVANAAAADVVVACVGETHYAEKPGDIDDLTLPGGQLDWFKQIVAANPNVVMILVEGRPRVLADIADLAPAVIHSYLPGPAGGEAIVDILTGLVNPSGRLPITYPRTVNNGPLQYNRRMSANTGGDYTPQWKFGRGLSYTQFALSNLQCTSVFPRGWECTLAIKNSGAVAGAFSAIFYARQQWRPIAPEAQRVVAFDKVFLEAGEAKVIDIFITLGEVSFVDEYNCEQGTSAPITISVYDNDEVPITTTVNGYAHRDASCSKWGAMWLRKTAGV